MVARTGCPPHLSRRLPRKRIISLTLLSLFSVSMLSACNTVAGAGKDVQTVGEKVEKKAEDCKDGRC